MKDYREVPLDVLRDFARSQTELSSIRTVAQEVGVGRSTLNKFVLGRTIPQPRVRRLLAVWYLKKVDEAEDIDVARPYAAALDILLSAIPDEKRSEAEQRFLGSLAQMHSRAGIQQPRWLELLRTHPR